MYGELDEQDVVLGARRRLLQCPGSFQVLAAEAAGRPRLAVRRSGQLTAALELLQVCGYEGLRIRSTPARFQRPVQREDVLGGASGREYLPPPGGGGLER